MSIREKVRRPIEWWRGPADADYESTRSDNKREIDHEMGKISDQIAARSDVLADAIQNLRRQDFDYLAKNEDALFPLAAVDMFVEKAQSVLTQRARKMAVLGTGLSIAAVVALVGLAVYIVLHTSQGQENLATNDLIIRVVSAISLGAIVLVAVKYLIALARSCFHESVTLLSRRHSLRFGRMYLYLNPGDVDIENLEKAFDWNRGGESSFLDITPAEIGSTPYSVLANAFAKAVGEAVAQALKSAKWTPPAPGPEPDEKTG